jgi:predicted kinase
MSVSLVPPQRLYIMQGIPGSGKSTLARTIQDQLMADTLRSVSSVILSTDEYWGENYEFDPSKLGETHAWNQRRCVEWMQSKTSYIFVDNTNIKKSHAEPYIVLAEVFGYEVTVVRVEVEVEVAVARNKKRPVNRRIPEDVVRRMHSEMESLL